MSFPRSKGKISEWSICTFNEAETFLSWDFQHLKTNTFEDEGARKGWKCVFKFLFFLGEKNMKKKKSKLA